MHRKFTRIADSVIASRCGEWSGIFSTHERPPESVWSRGHAARNGNRGNSEISLEDIFGSIVSTLKALRAYVGDKSPMARKIGRLNGQLSNPGLG